MNNNKDSISIVDASETEEQTEEQTGIEEEETKEPEPEPENIKERNDYEDILPVEFAEETNEEFEEEEEIEEPEKPSRDEAVLEAEQKEEPVMASKDFIKPVEKEDKKKSSSDDVVEEKEDYLIPPEQQEEYEYQYPQTYLDLDSMEVKAEVNFYLDGVISYIINDNDIIIRCPKGGLLRNAEALRNAKIQLTWKEPY